MSSKKTYQQLREELDLILQQLEGDSIDIDQALVQHKKGQKILEQMEVYLKEVSQAIQPKKSK